MRLHLSINLNMKACMMDMKDSRSYLGDVLIMLFFTVYSWQLFTLVSIHALDWWWMLKQTGPFYLSLTMKLIKIINGYRLKKQNKRNSRSPQYRFLDNIIILGNLINKYGEGYDYCSNNYQPNCWGILCLLQGRASLW